MASVISPNDTIQFDAPVRCSSTSLRVYDYCYTSAPTTFSSSLQLQLAVEQWFFGLDLHGMKDVGGGRGKKLLFALTITMRFTALTFSDLSFKLYLCIYYTMQLEVLYFHDYSFY